MLLYLTTNRNKMRFLDFKSALRDFPVFTYPDILKIDPVFHRRRLVEWQAKGYIKKIRQGIYCFDDYPVNEAFLYYISNRIHRPSYISMASAMSYYNLIPEAVYLITAISTQKTMQYKTPLGNFDFRNLKTSLFFGYRLIKMGNLIIKMAEPEKLILDYFYFLKFPDIESIESLRINSEVAREIIDFTKLNSYLKEYNSKILNKRIDLFNIYLNA